MSSFVGRRRELAEVAKLLPAARLVTFIGTGGVGKTRLALRVAAQTRRAFADGVVLVELAALLDKSLLEQTVADAAGLHDRSGRPPREVLVGHLRDRQLLLVLDNCEHLADGCAVLAAELLAAAPGLRILATSRHALRTSGEHIVNVSPLPLPGLDRGSPLDVDGNEAIQLFAERAAAVLPGFHVTADNITTLAGICRRLEGLPLAIELAAARVRVLSPAQILERLDDRFRLLSGGSRAVLPRHQTLQAVVNWSYELCSDQEQQLWARASVFAGGFDLDAAEAICAGDGIERYQVLDLVAGLVDKSILAREDHDPGQPARYRMLDTLRHYGEDALCAAGAAADLRRRHRDYYLDLAERGRAEWFGPIQPEVAARTRSEHANLRQALEFCLSTPGESQNGLRLAAALFFYWLGCGFVAEGRHWLDRALALDAEPSREWVTARWINAHLAVHQGEAATAKDMAEECQKWAQTRGDETTLAYALVILGITTWFSGDFPRAQTILEDALARFEAVGELNCTAVMTRGHLTGVAISQGNFDHAITTATQACVICESHGELWARSWALYGLARARWHRGEPEQARTHAMESLRIKHSLNDTLGIAEVVELLAWIAATTGEGERAAVLFGAVQQIWHLVIGQPLLDNPHWLVPHEASELQARATMGDRAFQAAFDRGADLDLDGVIAYVLDKVSPASPAAADHDPMAPLTPREQEVVELVAQGLSNKEVAARLVISRRTAEAHVEHILTKLGFTKRTQLAAWVAEQRESQNQ